MGNSLNKNTSYSDILFNEKICGENISISEDRTCAKRIRSFCKGICYANRPVDINEIICIKILETSENWAGGLKIGFTTQDIVHKYSKWKNSSHLSQRKKVSTYITPKYSCPNFQTSCWIKPIPLPYIQTNNYICLFINPNGRISLAINGQFKDTLITNLLVNLGKNGELSSKLWPMFDLYGNTVAIKLIPFCEFQLIFNSNMFGFSKGLTDYSKKQSKSIESSMADDLPNSTSSSDRNADMFHDPYKALIRAHKLHQYKFVASEPLSIHYRHAYDSAHPTQFIALPFHSLGRGRNVSIAFNETTPALTIMSNSTQNALNHDFMTQNSHDDVDNDEITCHEGNGLEESRLFRILNSLSAANALNHHSSFKSATSQFKKKCSPDQNNDILYQFTQAIRRPHEFCNAYVFTSRPIGTNEKVIIRIDSIDPTYVGTLGLGYTSCNPTTLHGQKLPDDSSSLMDRDEYWVVLKDSIPNSATNSLDTGDEIAMYYDNNGQIIVEMNGTMIGSDYYIDPSQELWAFWDLYGCVEKITILGSYHVILDLMQLHLQKQQRNETNDEENNNVESSNSHQIISLMNERNHNNNHNNINSQQNTTEINGPIHETLAIESSNIGSNNRALPIIRNQINPNNQGHTYYSIDLTNNKHHSQTNNNVDTKVITNLNKNIQSDDLSFLIPSQIYELSPPTENGASTSCVKSLLNNQIIASNSNYVNGSFNIVNGLENMASSKNKLKQATTKPLPTALSTNTVSTLSLNSTHSSCTSSERERFDQYNANIYHHTKQAPHNAKSNDPTGTHYINLGKNGDYGTLKQKTQHDCPPNISKESELSTLSATNDSININDRECIVCYENDINIMLYPCGHACMCNTCAHISWKAFQTAKIAKLNDGALNDEHNSQNYLTDPTITQRINQLSFEDSFDPDPENNNNSTSKDCVTNEKSTILGLCPICREHVKDVVKLYIP